MSADDTKDNKRSSAGPGGGPREAGLAGQNSETVTVDLTAGQRLEVTVVVTGDGRTAGLVLLNSDGKVIANSWGKTDDRVFNAKLPVNTSKLVVGEIPGNGIYKITVVSNLSGEFTLLAKDPSKKRDAIVIQKELKTARQPVEELEKELKGSEKGSVSK